MKFETGSQWKTRGGWRAVVVKNFYGKSSCCGLEAWHENSGRVLEHGLTGSYGLFDEFGIFDVEGSDNDLVEPWKEPVVHEYWVNFVKHKKHGVEIQGPFEKEQTADSEYRNLVFQHGSDVRRISRMRIKFEEGEGLARKNNF